MLSQIKVEADRYGNAILTDNMEWRFWRAGDTEMYTGLRIMELVDGKLILREDNITSPIMDTFVLALELAAASTSAKSPES